MTGPGHQVFCPSSSVDFGPTTDTNVRLRCSATWVSREQHPAGVGWSHPDQVIRPQTTIDAAKWLAEHAGNDIDSMPGIEFERCLAVMFARLGYEVEFTEAFDFGADLLVFKDGVRTAVQAKRQAKKVGDHAVQQAIAGRDYYKCHTASVVTTAGVQPRVRTLAGKTGVSILDRQHLTRMLQMARMVESPELLPAPDCSRCRTPLVRRTGAYGPFWGCVNYPRGCRMNEQFRYSLVVLSATAVGRDPSNTQPAIQSPAVLPSLAS